MNWFHILIFVIFIQIVKSSQSLCSSDNTGSTSSESLYMSNGLCSQTCAQFAFAIVQGENCWCSNYSPSSTTDDVSDCSDDCPGYPSEQCGNTDKGLYGYIQLGTPSSSSSKTSSKTSTTSSETSTKSSSSTTDQTSDTSGTQTTSDTSTSSTETSSTSTQSSSTVQQSSSSVKPSSTSSSPSSSSSTSPSSSTTSSSASSSTTDKPSSSETSTSSVEPITSIIYSVRTITGSSSPQLTTTQIISTIYGSSTSTPTSSSSNELNDANNSNNNKSTGFFSHPGKVAGVFTVVGLIIVALIGILLYFCLFKKRKNHDEDSDVESTLSHGGNEKSHTIDPTIIPPINNNSGDRGNGNNTRGNNSGIPDEEFDFVSNDQTDQRLDPRQMFMNWENDSRKSLADELDYSRRVLRVTNAD